MKNTRPTEVSPASWDGSWLEIPLQSGTIARLRAVPPGVYDPFGQSPIRSYQSPHASSDPLASVGESIAWMYGSMQALFGPPWDPTEPFYYLIEMQLPNVASSRYISVYHGSTGPNFGGKDMTTEEAYQARDILKELLDTTPPKEYEVTYYADEYESTINYGCTQGRCWYQEPQ